MLDATSLKILQILQDKARIPNTEVSRLVGLAPSAVLERIRKMESQGIIDGYEVRLNPEWFQRNLVAFINVSVRGENDVDGYIGQQLSSIDEIQEVHYIAGEDSYLIKVRVADITGLNLILRSKISHIKGVIATKTYTVLASYKETAKIPIR